MVYREFRFKENLDKFLREDVYKWLIRFSEIESFDFLFIDG